MREIAGDIWEAHALGYWVAITTNGFTKQSGEAVMGRGVAKQAAQRFPALPADLGGRLVSAGNHVHRFSALRLFTFPVKHHWRERADTALIVQSAQELVAWLNDPGPVRIPAPDKAVCLVRPGCGNGQLRWEDVKPLIAPILDDRVVIMERP